MSRITVVLKTNEGGMWVVPQVRALQAAGETVTVVLPAGNGRLRRALDREQVPVVEAPLDFRLRPGLRAARGLWALRQVLRRTRPDVLFYHLYASALACRVASLGLGCRRVHMVAGPLYLESAPIRHAERLLCRLDATIVAGSEFTAQRYRELGMPGGRVCAVPYGVDVEHYTRGADRRQELFGCGPGTFVVVMVAYVYAPKGAVHRGRGIKGHEVLLPAWQAFRDHHPQSLLVLVGAGFDTAGEAHRQRLMRRFDVGSDPGIRWLDSVEDVRPLYSSADLSVTPSLSENHGAVLEASAMGLPSLVTDAGALPETVTEHTGFVVRRGDETELRLGLERAHTAYRQGRLAAMGSDARRLCEDRFAHQVVLPRLVRAVHGCPAEDGHILALSEQRGWLREGQVLVRKQLPLVQLLGERADVRLALRVGPAERGGVPPATSATVIPLPAPRRSNPVRAVAGRLSAARLLVAQIRAATVVYADQPGIVGAAGLLLARTLRKPIVVNVVGDSRESVHPSVLPGMKGQVAYRLLPRLQAWACARATYVNYVTSSVLQQRYPALAARATFASSTVRALGPPRERCVPAGPVRVVTVGSLEQRYKGVADLVEAVRCCRRGGLDLRLTVVGEGRLRPALERLAEQRLGPGVARFTGHLYGEDLYVALGQHDVFALASWTEGLPRALIEAMADGMPAVATAVGGVPELLEPHRTVPPRAPDALAEALLRLLSDPAAWQATIRHNQRATAEILSRRDGILCQFTKAVAALVCRAGMDRDGSSVRADDQEREAPRMATSSSA